ncbi:MAG: RluA family pseudouridine synthase, partial [Defluviitaleaceae bacterium]|nr:RluA family pseudouridine synthase [Defluviitaleaceae bacterium]
MRIDAHLAKETNFSRSRIAELIKKGEILVNGNKVKPSYILEETDEIQMDIKEEPTEIELIPENIPLNIVYEDEDLAVINKPKGMVVHPAPGNFSGTLVNALLY